MMWALVLPLLALAAPGDTPVREHQITAEDLFTLSSVADVAMSPDGAWVAWTESRWSEAGARTNDDLWVKATEGGEAHRLTFSETSDEDPQFSPDSEWIYFRSAELRAQNVDPPYNGAEQVFRIRPDGSGMQPVTESVADVHAFDLLADGSGLIYQISAERPVDDSFASLREAHQGTSYAGDKVRTARLMRLDFADWRVTEVMAGKRQILDFAVSPNSDRLAVLSSPDEALFFREGWSRVDVLDLASSVVVTLPDALWREEAPSPYGWLEGLAWSADGGALAFGIDYDGFPAEVFVASFTARGFEQIWKIERPAGYHAFPAELGWLPPRRELCFPAAHEARIHLVCVSDVRDGYQGHASARIDGDAVVWGWDVDGRGKTMVTAESGLDFAHDLFVATGDMRSPKRTRFTRINPQMDTWKLPRIQIVSWKAEDGSTVEGVLELPSDYSDSDGMLPLVVHLHGGPTWATTYRFAFRGYGRALFAANGYALFSPNYRGSIGYGDEFLTELIGRENDIEVSDVLAGVDHLVAEGIADPDKLGVMGWSNGGFVTNCLITKTPRFKAAISGAGVIDQALQWGIEDTPGHVINFMEGLPWEKPAETRAASPLYDLHKVTTPTLVQVGERDARVPLAHARSLHRGLKHYLGVTTELLIFPGEAHGLSRRSSRGAKMAWDLAWMDHFLKGERLPTDKARRSE